MDRHRGFSSIWMASALLFLLGAAALAVDLSGFFQDARSQQRAADMACLAGVIELPEDRPTALSKAATYLKPNEPGLQSLDVGMYTDTGNIRSWTSGQYVVEIETPYNAEDTQMRVTILRASPTSFGRVLGSDSVDVLEQAVCEVGSALGAGADMPFGVLSGFSGGIINFSRNDCTLNGDSNDTCSGLAIPRKDDPTGSQFGVTTADNYIANMISGINWDLEPETTGDILCRTVGTPGPGDPEPCNRVATVSGNDPSKIYTGLIEGFRKYSPDSEDGYLQKHTLTYSHGGNRYDSDTLEDVADCADGTCTSPWGSLTWTAGADATETLTLITDCDCPRFVRIPVVQSFPLADCTVNDPSDPDQVNRCTAKIIGFEWAFILRPFFNGESPPNTLGDSFTDFTSAGAGSIVETIAAAKLVFSPDIEVKGGCFSEYKSGAPKAVRLIPG